MRASKLFQAPTLKLFTVIFTVCFCAAVCSANERRDLRATVSPDKKIVIVEENSEQGGHVGDNFYFEEASSHQKLGAVLPASQRGSEGVTKVAVVASWNRDSSNVALLVFYGTKLNELLLFVRDKAGQFKPVVFRMPEVEPVFKQRTGHALPERGGGPDENAVGSWLDENTVRLVAGITLESGNRNGESHVFVSFTARVQGKSAAVSEVELHGPFSEKEATKFTKKWGTRYFEANKGN